MYYAVTSVIMFEIALNCRTISTHITVSISYIRETMHDRKLIYIEKSNGNI